MDKHDNNAQTIDVPPSHVVVQLTGHGRARTVKPFATGLFCKVLIGHKDGEDEHEVLAQTMDNLSPELYNTIFATLEDDYTELADNLSKIAEQIGDSIY